MQCIHTLHRRLGHTSFPVTKKMQDYAQGLNLEECNVFLDCAVCKKAKPKNAAVPKCATRQSTSNFQLVHIDLVGPYEASFGGNKYILTIVDDFSRYGYVYLLKEKSEAFQTFKDFANLIATVHNLEIPQIQSNRRTELMSTDFKGWMRRNGIRHLTSTPYTPVQNGVVERRNDVLQIMMHSLLEDANLKFGYWGEAVLCANYIINRTWSHAINQTPYFLMYGTKPNLSHLRIFGSFAWVKISKQRRSKGDEVAKRMRFVGYATGSKAYRFVDKGNRIIISRSAKFENADWSSTHANDTPAVSASAQSFARSNQASGCSTPSSSASSSSRRSPLTVPHGSKQATKDSAKGEKEAKSPTTASGEQTTLEQLGQEATCPLCLDFFEQPMVLSCGHNFCRNCLAQLGAEFPCPQCRAKMQLRSACPNQPLANIICHLKRQLSEGAHKDSRGHQPAPAPEKPRLQQVSVTLDVSTAHPWLQCSRRKATWVYTCRECRDVPERFDTEFCVLGRERFTSGRYCWEAQVDESADAPVWDAAACWAIGVARESVRRKGSFQLSPQEGIWAVGQDVEGENVAFTKVPQKLSWDGSLCAVEVRLDCEAGEVQLLNPEMGTSLYTFRTGPLRGEALRPFFYLGQEEHSVFTGY